MPVINWRMVCGMFVTSKDDQHKIDSTAYADAVECIENCDEFLDSIPTMADHLINELRHVWKILKIFSKAIVRTDLK